MQVVDWFEPEIALQIPQSPLLLTHVPASKVIARVAQFTNTPVMMIARNAAGQIVRPKDRPVTAGGYSRTGAERRRHRGSYRSGRGRRGSADQQLHRPDSRGGLFNRYKRVASRQRAERRRGAKHCRRTVSIATLLLQWQDQLAARRASREMGCASHRSER